MSSASISKESRRDTFWEDILAAVHVALSSAIVRTCTSFCIVPQSDFLYNALILNLVDEPLSLLALCHSCFWRPFWRVQTWQ